MAGGKSTPKKDKALKVSNGMEIKTSQILARGIATYKAGINARGLNTIFALCPGKVYFTKKMTSHGKMRTHINVKPAEKPAK